MVNITRTETMKRRVSGIFLLILISLGWSRSAFAQGKTDFTLSVPDEIYEGEQFKISFTVNADGKKFKMDEPSGLNVLYGPSQSSSQRIAIINGNRTSEQHTTFTYVLLAEKAGDYEIPAATVMVGSATYKTQSRKIKVFPSSARRSGSAANTNGGSRGSTGISDNDVFVVATASKTSIYEQEGTLVTFKVYSLLDFNFEDVKFPDFEGFIAQDVPAPQVQQLKAEQYKGKVYRTIEIKQVYLFPQRSGQLVVPSGTIDLVVSVPVRAQFDSEESIFDSFFSTYQNVRKTIKSKPISIQVKPLPTPKPEGFDGAVGQYSLSAELPQSVVKANESLTVKLTLKGEGNLKLTQIPTPAFPEGFEAYDPKEDDQIDVTLSGVRGSKSKEFFAVPRHAGDFVIPKIDFAYFDPTTATYKTIKIDEMKVHVDKGDVTTQTSVSNFTDKQEIKYLGEDIRYIKRSTSSTRANTPSLPLYVLAYALAAVGGLIVFAIVRAKRKEMGDLSIYKSKRAGKHAKRWLKLAILKKNSGDHTAYFEALLKGLSDYLSSKLQLPLSNLSKDTIAETMQARGVEVSLINKTLSVLSTLELARYTPTGEVGEKDQLYNQCAEVIESLESQKL